MEGGYVLACWVSFCCAIIAILRQALRLGVASLNVMASTGLVYTLGEVTGVGLDSELGLILGLNAVLLSVTT